MSGNACVGRSYRCRFLQFPPCPADTRGSVDDDAVRLHQPRIDQWLEREDRGGRVATRGGYRLGAPDRVPVQLGNAVNECLQQLRRLVWMAVPALVRCRVVQPEVRAEVDKGDALSENRAGDLLALPMRQSCENQVD